MTIEFIFCYRDLYDPWTNLTYLQGFMAFGEDELLRIPFRFVVYVIAGLPFSALALCVFLSLLLHWDEATRTHCGVANWLPSVSAAVASYAPERYIWRLFIGIHGSPRIALAIAFRLVRSLRTV